MNMPIKSPSLAFASVIFAGWQIAGAVCAQDLPAKSMTVNGTTLAYVEEGAGEPVVFVHGSISDHRVFEGQREAIASDYQYIAYTRRYFGEQEWPDEGTAFGEQTDAADLIAFVEGLDRGPVHIVSWSGGAPVGVLAALERPDLFRSMTIFEPGGSLRLLLTTAEGEAAFKERTDGLAAANSAVAAGNLEEAVEEFADATWKSPGAFAALTDDQKSSLLASGRTLLLRAVPVAPPITCETLGTLEIPTLVIAGDQTWTFFAMIADAVVDCLPDARKVVIPGANHGSPMLHPGAVNEVILEFLTDRDGV